jgi:hypothetical protein
MSNTWTVDQETKQSDNRLRKSSLKESLARHAARLVESPNKPIKYSFHQLMDLAAKACAERLVKGQL